MTFADATSGSVRGVSTRCMRTRSPFASRRCTRSASSVVMRRGRDLRLLLVVAQRAGVRRAQRCRGDGADHRGHGAVLRGAARAGAAEDHRLRIRLERAAALDERHVHRAVVEDDLAGDLRAAELRQLIERRHLDDVRGDARGRRGHAAAEGGQDDALVIVRDQARRAPRRAPSAAPSPPRCRTSMPHSLNRFVRPLHRQRRALRSRKPRPDVVGEIRERLVPLRIREDVIDEACRGLRRWSARTRTP